VTIRKDQFADAETRNEKLERCSRRFGTTDLVEELELEGVWRVVDVLTVKLGCNCLDVLDMNISLD
jgi:hypothetical protein